MKYLPILFALLFASCAPKIPTARIVPEPARAVAVAPRAIVVNEKVSAAQTTAVDLRTGITRAMDEANRLRLQRSANEVELSNMWSMLTKEKEHAERLLTQLNDTKKESAILAADAVFKDIEVTQLRQANETLSNQVGNAIKNETASAAKIEKLSKKAAVYDFVMRWIWIGLIGLVLLSIIYGLIRFGPSVAARFVRPV